LRVFFQINLLFVILFSFLFWAWRPAALSHSIESPWPNETLLFYLFIKIKKFICWGWVAWVAWVSWAAWIYLIFFSRHGGRQHHRQIQWSPRGQAKYFVVPARTEGNGRRRRAKPGTVVKIVFFIYLFINEVFPARTDGNGRRRAKPWYCSKDSRNRNCHIYIYIRILKLIKEEIVGIGTILSLLRTCPLSCLYYWLSKVSAFLVDRRKAPPGGVLSFWSAGPRGCFLSDIIASPGRDAYHDAHVCHMRRRIHVWWSHGRDAYHDAHVLHSIIHVSSSSYVTHMHIMMQMSCTPSCRKYCYARGCNLTSV